MLTFHQPSSGLFKGHASAKAILLIACVLVLLGKPLLATPAEDITQAAFVSGGSDISQARPKQFVRAFTSVALRTPPRDLPDYVTAAIGLRPDLAPKIVAAAVKVASRHSESKRTALCEIVDRIVRAAIAANPEAILSIGRAAVETNPALRHCVASSVIVAAREQGLAPSSAANLSMAMLSFGIPESPTELPASFGTGTMNPANLSDRREGSRVNSPEQPPTD